MLQLCEAGAKGKLKSEAKGDEKQAVRRESLSLPATVSLNTMKKAASDKIKANKKVGRFMLRMP